MKGLWQITAFICIHFFSCQNSQNISAERLSTTEISLSDLGDHPNKAFVESRINNYDEEFLVLPSEFDFIDPNHLVLKKYHFETKSSKISVKLIFCKDQKDAIEIANLNYTTILKNQLTGINGAVLSIIEGDETDKLNELAAWFAGEE